MGSSLALKTAPEVQFRTKGERTRERILDLAYTSIVEKGFAATSIEELIEGAGISKSGFFYHFRDKGDLARSLLERYLAQTDTALDDLESRARALHDDPLHALLIFLRLWAQELEDMFAQFQGCLVSAVAYQELSFDAEVRAMNRNAVLGWRTRFLRWLEEIAEVHAPVAPIPLVDLADHFSVVVDGAIVLSKSIRDPGVIPRQAAVVRETVRLVFGA